MDEIYLLYSAYSYLIYPYLLGRFSPRCGSEKLTASFKHPSLANLFLAVHHTKASSIDYILVTDRLARSWVYWNL